MAIAEWSDNSEYYVWRGEVWIPKNFDPNSRGAVIMLGPAGGTAIIPALVQGDPGRPFAPRDVVMTELAHDDPSPASAEWVEITPPTDTIPGIYDLHLTLHGGEPGDDGTMTILGATDLETGVDDANVVAGWTVAVNSDLDGFELVPPKIGGTWWPTVVNATAAGAGDNRDICSVTIPAQPAAYRLRVSGQCPVDLAVPGANDLRVDLVARLSGSGTPIVGRYLGPAGSYPFNLPLISGCPTGSTTDYAKVAANTAKTVTLRTEKQSGSDDYITGAGATLCVEVAFVP